MKNITPEKYRCGSMFPACPAVYEMPDGKLLIIGRRADLGESCPPISDDEMAIVIPADLIPVCTCATEAPPTLLEE
jgi:hypothetical protein